MRPCLKFPSVYGWNQWKCGEKRLVGVTQVLSGFTNIDGHQVFLVDHAHVVPLVFQMLLEQLLVTFVIGKMHQKETHSQEGLRHSCLQTSRQKLPSEHQRNENLLHSSVVSSCPHMRLCNGLWLALEIRGAYPEALLLRWSCRTSSPLRFRPDLAGSSSSYFQV